FTYAAATDGDPQWKNNLNTMPWDWRPWRGRLWQEIGNLRCLYNLNILGGWPTKDLAQRKLQQRLPFFEIAIPHVPLTVLGLDTGATGSIDRLQYQWLVDCLARARRDDRLILVMLSAPLYVDGQFAEQKDARATGHVAAHRQRRSYGPREIYKQLRKYRVNV